MRSSVRLELGRRDGWSCHYCGILLVPDDLSNLVLACGSCNATKGRKTREEFLAKHPKGAPRRVFA